MVFSYYFLVELCLFISVSIDLGNASALQQFSPLAISIFSTIAPILQKGAILEQNLSELFINQSETSNNFPRMLIIW